MAQTYSDKLSKLNGLSNKNHPPTRMLPPKNRKPLWAGPDVNGITFSLLSKFLVCRERFRLKVVEGLEEDLGFNKSIEFGSMWHEMEEGYYTSGGSLAKAEARLAIYRNKLIASHQSEQAEINKWAALCKMQFPLYIKHWRKHNDDKSRKPILEEVSFKLPYTLPSGRTVYLRGKFDNVHLANRPDKHHEPDLYRAWVEHFPDVKQGIFLQENKTKGDIKEKGILDTVAFNLQTMIYQTALRISYHAKEGELHRLAGGLITHANIPTGVPIIGTLYNVVRRPLADRFAIKQRKGRKAKGKVTGAESMTQFYQRVIEGIASDPGHYFMRWKTIITEEDMTRFRQRMLDPILEQLCDWWEWIKADPFNPWRLRTAAELEAASIATTKRYAYPHVPSADAEVENTVHFQSPWGVYNSMFGGYDGDYYEYLTTGRKNSLRRITSLFPELT